MERLSSSIVEEAKIELQTILGGGQIDVQMEHLGIRAQSSCQEVEDIKVSFRTEEDFQGPVQVYAKFFEKGSICQEWSFQSRLAITASLPVASRAVSALSEISIEMRPMRYDKINGTLVFPGKEPIVARTTLKKWQPITMERVKRKPLNYDGDMVELIWVSKGLEIRGKGKLMSDALEGENVRVLSLATATVLEGILVKKDAVEIGRRLR